MRLYLFLFSFVLSTTNSFAVNIGSKVFTESYVLAEFLAQKIESSSLSPSVNRNFGLGGTGIVYEALVSGQIDLYPEYTGTIAQVILKQPHLRSEAEIRGALKKIHLQMSAPLGFNNTYALAIRHETAEKYGVKKISELKNIISNFKPAFSHEFINRSDGIKALSNRYGFDLSKNAKAMEHSLCYEAIAKSEADLIDVYSTDAKIKKLDLIVLEDDLGFFPKYEAVVIARDNFVQNNPAIWKMINSLRSSLDESTMRTLNAGVDIEKKSFSEVVSSFLGIERYVKSPAITDRVWYRTKEHFLLVGVAILFSILIGVPLGLVSSGNRFFGQAVLLLSSLIQTIPSLALLCFLIPLFGIGLKPALVALCLYGLLPVIVGTSVGVQTIDPKLLETALAIGLDKRQRLFKVILPIASPQILAGIKTSLIISIGTATLAALIGAGGYGVPIVTGLAINDTSTILIGAIPAALLALLAHILFEIIKLILIPKGIR